MEFESPQLDFLERCEPCFRRWMTTPEDQREKISKPFVPIYNSENRYK